ncbi:(2Fe-2S)-binding protein [Candidatus Micrarchaeota archaeon]|nr:(2Fe-2S)-binding protein [Candidatus Micrarchaeota archaeon]
MAKVKIINEDKTLEIPVGANILEYAKEKTAFPYGCENAECCQCLCTVIKGIENLESKDHKEWALLSKKGTYPNQRLGCQLRVKKEGDIEIEY